MELKVIWTIIHLFGVALGAGGAYVSDGMFFQSIKDKMLTQTEIGFMQLGSRITWLGLGLLLVSGIGLFLTDPASYSQSSKFQIKMLIVLVLTINGIYFHLSHIPFLKERQNKKFSELPKLVEKRTKLIFSGVVSVASWSLAIALGALRSIPFTFIQALITYVIIITFGCLVAYVMRNKFIPLK